MAPRYTLLPSKSDESLDQDKQTPTNDGSAAHTEDAVNIESLIKELGGESIKNELQTRKLGVMFRELRVVGLAGTAVQHNLASLFYPRSIMKHIHSLFDPPVRDIVSGFEGVVLPGEMLLVLGRPGSGCSTLLKTLANHREEYRSVFGDVLYDSFTSEEIGQQYRGDVIYCPEDDIHFPTLTVRETLEFASTMRTPNCRSDNQSREAYAMQTTELLMAILGLRHTRHTIIGDAFLRGISGGEKKRVSIAEVMSARPKLVCWDNTTRGLDSSTALDFIRILRVAADTTKVTTVVSLYQAGEQLFELFDKVCLIYEGKMVYLGPVKESMQYFTNMGYEPLNRQTTPDFLVAVTDPNARETRPGFQGNIPQTADEMVAYFQASAYGQLNRSSIDSYYNLYVNEPELKSAYVKSAANEHARHAPHSSSYTLSIPMQLHAVMRRRLQILNGDWLTLAVQFGVQIFQAVLVGTVFLQLGSDTLAYISRGNVLYFALFCGSTLMIAEVPALFSQRLIVRRHQKGALYYPFIEALAHSIIDIPISFMSITVMSVIFYSLVGLQKTMEQFLIYLLLTFVVTLVLKAWFRSIAAFSTSEATALPVVGATLLVMVMYAGYPVPSRNIVGALRWIADLNPLRYAYESLVVNEFHTINGTCTVLVPVGPGFEEVKLANQACLIIGSRPGMATVPGEDYMSAFFDFSYSNLWKNFGILVIFCFTFLGSLLFFSQYNKRTARDTTVTMYKEGSVPVPAHPQDKEKSTSSHVHEKGDQLDTIDNKAPKPETPRTDIFSWKNIHYDVHISGGETRRLLDDVSGYVIPGTLTALMGESGAGKTVLLNVLAQHLSEGMMGGECLVNGHPLQADFASQTAYVQQLDTHIPEPTVREALLFSARLRQPPSVPMAEKEAYVDKCLKMCGLEAYANAIVGSLDVEHKKRATIGVELAAKPKLLLFVDEPTSGLDSQSAWAIIKFLRELADNGLAILCTIHQPSGELFQLFDRLLLLQKGGQTVYFGDIGENSTTMIKYFERNGAAPCPADTNPAEYMLNVIGAGITAECTIDWNQAWKTSPEAIQLNLELKRIHRRQFNSAKTTSTHSEFASSWMKQLVLLTHRGLICQWRNPTYVYSKLSVCIFTGLLVGLTYFGTENSMQALMGKLFSVLVLALICLPMGQQLQAKFIESRTVYEVREYPSRIFTWSAFLVSQVLIELPVNILAMTLLLACWYWSSGLDFFRAGFTYLLYCIAFPLFYVTLSLAIAVVSANGTIATTLLGIVVTVTMMFSGIIQWYSLLGWWKWMYHLSPFTYLIDGFFGQTFGNQRITCAPVEFITIEPPSGMTCGAYMTFFTFFTGGYLANPEATTQCKLCPFQSTTHLMQFLFNLTYGRHWRDLHTVLGFVCLNVLLMFAGMYVRIRHGFGVKRLSEMIE